MSSVRGLALLGVLLVGALAACGGSGHPATTTSSTAGAASQIKANWQSFFSSKEPDSSKPALIQNGSRFSSAIEALAKNPLAKNTSAKVSSVKLQGPSKAKVVYSIYLGSTPALKHQTGYALKQNGTWVIADASLCSLLQLEGGAPSVCKK